MKKALAIAVLLFSAGIAPAQTPAPFNMGPERPQNTPSTAPPGQQAPASRAVGNEQALRVECPEALSGSEISAPLLLAQPLRDPGYFLWRWVRHRGCPWVAPSGVDKRSPQLERRLQDRRATIR